MKNKIKKILMSSIIFIMIITSFSSGLNASNKILLVDNNNVSIDSKIVLNINLNSIDYTNSKIQIFSSKKLDNIEINNNQDIQINQESNDNNELEFNYNKETSTVSNLSLTIGLTNDTKVGDKYTFRILVQDLNDENNYVEEYQEITIIDTQSTEKKEETNKTENTIINNKTSQSVIKSTTSAVKSSSMQNMSQDVYNGSTNNYLKSLSVKNYSLNTKFKKENNTYFITVKSTVKNISIKATASSSKATVAISGNKNLKTGINKVLITVTAEDGSTRNYRIYVTKEQ